MVISRRSMYSFLLATAFDKLRDLPCALLNARLLRRRATQGSVRLDEVVIREIEIHRSTKIREFFAEGIGQAGQAAAVHPQGMVLLLNVARANCGDFRRSLNDGLLNVHNV